MKFKKYVGILLVLALLLTGCGDAGTNNDNTSDTTLVSSTSTQTESGFVDEKSSSSTESAEEEISSNEATETREELTGDGSNSDNNLGAPGDRESAQLEEYTKVYYKELDKEDLPKYQEQVRAFLFDKFGYTEDMVTSEFYGNFDPFDDETVHGVIFVGAEKPIAAYHLYFEDEELWISGALEFNHAEDEESEFKKLYPMAETYRYPQVTKATMMDVKAHAYDTPLNSYYNILKMIYVETPLAENGTAFELLNFEGGELNKFQEFFLMPTAEAVIFDKDEDGIYEGYSLYRMDYNTIFYPIHQEFGFGMAGTLPLTGLIYLSEIPNEDPEELVWEYINLCYIRDAERAEYYEYLPLTVVAPDGEEPLENRLEKMADIPFEEGYVWNEEIVANTVLMLRNSSLVFETTIDGDKATVKTSVQGVFDQSMEGIGNFPAGNFVTYELEKRDKGWIITAQELVDAYEVSEESLRDSNENGE